MTAAGGEPCSVDTSAKFNARLFPPASDADADALAGGRSRAPASSSAPSASASASASPLLRTRPSSSSAEAAYSRTARASVAGPSPCTAKVSRSARRPVRSLPAQDTPDKQGVSGRDGMWGVGGEALPWAQWKTSERGSMVPLPAGLVAVVGGAAAAPLLFGRVSQYSSQTRRTRKRAAARRFADT